MQAASVKGSPSSCWLWALHDVKFMHSCYKKFDNDVIGTRYDSIKKHQSVLHLFVEKGVFLNFYTTHLDVRIHYCRILCLAGCTRAIVQDLKTRIFPQVGFVVNVKGSPNATACHYVWIKHWKTMSWWNTSTLRFFDFVHSTPHSTAMLIHISSHNLPEYLLYMNMYKYILFVYIHIYTNDIWIPQFQSPTKNPHQTTPKKTATSLRCPHMQAGIMHRH